MPMGHRPNTKLHYSPNKFSKHRPSGPMLSISRNVRLSVCPSVCLCVCSLLRYRLLVFLPPLPKVGCPIFLEIRNPWGKVMERSGLRYEHFMFENSLKSPQKKKSFFLHFFRSSSVFGLFNGLFALTSRSRMSNIFRDSESLGKSNGKKWSQI